MLNTPRTRQVALVVCALLVNVGDSRADNWTRYEVGDGTLSAEFPTEPTRQVRTVPDTPSHMFACVARRPGKSYGAIAYDDLGFEIGNYTAEQFNDFYTEIARGLSRSLLSQFSRIDLGDQLVEKELRPVVLAGLPGREKEYLVGAYTKLTIRMAIRGRRVYVAFVAAENLNSNNDVFFNSLRVKEN